MAVLDIQKEIREALLDESFLRVFAQRFQQALAAPPQQEEKKHAPEELELHFNVTPDDHNAFMVSANRLYEDDPEILVFDQSGLLEKPPSPVEISHRVKALIVRGLRDTEQPSEIVLWAGLRVKDKEVTDG